MPAASRAFSNPHRVELNKNMISSLRFLTLQKRDNMLSPYFEVTHSNNSLVITGHSTFNFPSSELLDILKSFKNSNITDLTISKTWIFIQEEGTQKRIFNHIPASVRALTLYQCYYSHFYECQRKCNPNGLSSLAKNITTLNIIASDLGYAPKEKLSILGDFLPDSLINLSLRGNHLGSAILFKDFMMKLSLRKNLKTLDLSQNDFSPSANHAAERLIEGLNCIKNKKIKLDSLNLSDSNISLFTSEKIAKICRAIPSVTNLTFSGIFYSKKEAIQLFVDSLPSEKRIEYQIALLHFKLRPYLKSYLSSTFNFKDIHIRLQEFPKEYLPSIKTHLSSKTSVFHIDKLVLDFIEHVTFKDSHFLGFFDKKANRIDANKKIAEECPQFTL